MVKAPMKKSKTVDHFTLVKFNCREVPSINWSEYRNTWLAQRGGLPDVYATVQDCQRKEGPSRRQRLDRQPRRAMDLQRPKEKEEEMAPPEIEMPPIKAQLDTQIQQEADVMEAPVTPLASEASIPRAPSPQAMIPISSKISLRTQK